MTVDIPAAASFLATHARLLDRRRFELMSGAVPDPGATEAVLAAVDGYRNPDGGYGWGLEPDLRAGESQPGGALHALEVFEEIAPVISPRAAGLCDWLAGASRPDGGLPFALPVADPAGCAPFWVAADPTGSTLQSTAFAAATAWRVAAHDPAVAAHPWLHRATDYCLAAITALDTAPHAIALCFAVRLLDAAHDALPEVADLLAGLGRFVPDSGMVPVDGGSAGESMRPLDFAPDPDGPARALFRPDAVRADLDRLAGLQQPDGGWTPDFGSFSPAAALEWRGYQTVRAVRILRRHGRA